MQSGPGFLDHPVEPGIAPPPTKKIVKNYFAGKQAYHVKSGILFIFPNPEIPGLKHCQSRDSGLRKWARIPGFGIPGLESLYLGVRLILWTSNTNTDIMRDLYRPRLTKIWQQAYLSFNQPLTSTNPLLNTSLVKAYITWGGTTQQRVRNGTCQNPGHNDRTWGRRRADRPGMGGADRSVADRPVRRTAIPKLTGSRIPNLFKDYLYQGCKFRLFQESINRR